MTKELFLQKVTELVNEMDSNSTTENVLNAIHSLLDISNDIIKTKAKRNYPAIYDGMKEVLNETYNSLANAI